MLALLFACCGLRRRTHDPPAECAPLIPQSDDTPSPQPRLIDHHKLKERLGSVVRSKEGKMVNVNAQSPFSLQHPDSSSRSSRNVSGGTVPSSRAPSSPSPSPPRPLQKSPSATSLRPDPEDPPLPLVAAPILNVRLVKSARSTRGRPQRNGHTQPQSEQHTTSEHPSTHLPEAPPFPEDFSIHDAGAVARSWGD